MIELNELNGQNFLDPQMILLSQIRQDNDGNSWLALKIQSDWMHTPCALVVHHNNSGSINLSIKIISSDISVPTLDNDDIPLIWDKAIVSRFIDTEKNGGMSSQFGFCVARLPGPTKVAEIV